MLDVPQFLLADAAAVTGMEFNTLRSQISRGAVPLTGNDQPAEGRGGRYLVTLRTVYLIALIAELTSYGMSPGQASLAAQKFTHLVIFYEDPAKSRKAGELFPEGLTILLIFSPPPSVKNSDPSSTLGHGASTILVNITDDRDYIDLCKSLLNKRSSAIFVNCNDIVSRVNAKVEALRSRRHKEA
ncbi:hypothetical protein M446_1179 [Methylobacterium sp. 4-46]|uniref:hypothetical protein n=1 Tax=unclassified Methylobacterium TaxID=2615210 RepID=UPI000152CDDB|nr:MULTISPECIES: hypothetical protein [Methylobacterium]ACA15704.1 hypothetical protein M446_1179 [Methylobacterium sp. 4-46]WFT81440.1 hypothetical protein QA634_06005 [Methylobacterium nodulans]